MTTPVSLPLTSTLPPLGTSVLPSSISQSLPPSLNNPSTTRILLLSNFSPELKTRDIQMLFSEWEEEKGGLKVKWQDDESCWIVFNDPGVAKRAFLTLLSSPPPALQATETHDPKLTPYTGADVNQILSAVQNRPRSRSNASSMNGGHSRKGSLLGSGGAGVGSMGGGAAGGHNRSHSFGRNGRSGGSFGQKQVMDMMSEGGNAPPVPNIPSQHANGNGNANANGVATGANANGVGSPTSEKNMADVVEEKE